MEGISSRTNIVPAKQRTRNQKKGFPAKCRNIVYRLLAGRMTLLWMLICVSGNIFQVYELSFQYLKFPITTNVQLVVQDELEMPSVTLCFHLIHLIKWDTLTWDERRRILQTQENLDFLGLNRDIISGYQMDKENEEQLKKLPMILREYSSLPVTVRLTSNIHHFNVPRIFNMSHSFFDLVTGGLLYTEYKGDFNTPYSSFKQETFDEMVKLTTFLKDHLKCFQIQPKKEFRKVG
jgi:hypothetical protein